MELFQDLTNVKAWDLTYKLRVFLDVCSHLNAVLAEALPDWEANITPN